MNKKIVVAVCLIALATSAFAVGGHAKLGKALRPYIPTSSDVAPATAKSLSAANPTPTAPMQPAVPEHAVYNELFYHVNFLKKKADKEQQAGRDASVLRSFYKRQAKLDDAQSDLLEMTARGLARDAEVLDRQAEKIIKKFRSDVQKIVLKLGDRLPEPPAVLKTMQAERDSLVMRARDSLRAGLGEEAFQRLDQYVQENIARKMTAERLDRPRPANPNRPR